MNDVLTLILGGGRGARLFPLARKGRKPAVPIGGKYRLIDIPISNCLHAGLKRMFVLTQFNSASLNRHIAQTYRLDVFSDGFVEILAAEQTAGELRLVSGHGRRRPPGGAALRRYDADNYLILAGDHLYRMDFNDLIESHIEGRADITIAAQPVTPADATQMGIFRFDVDGQIVGFEEKPTRRGSPRSAAARRAATVGRRHVRGEAVRRLDGHLRLLARRAARDADAAGHRLRQGDHPEGAREVPRAPLRVPRLLGGRRHDRRVLRRQHPADAARRAVQLLPSALADLHAPALPARHAKLRLPDRFVDRRRRAATSMAATVRESVIGIRTHVAPGLDDHAIGAARRRLLRGGAGSNSIPLGIGRDVVLDRVIVDKNARIGDGVRLVNEAGVQEADGDGYYIRNGIIIVPKGAAHPAGRRRLKPPAAVRGPRPGVSDAPRSWRPRNRTPRASRAFPSRTPMPVHHHGRHS